MAKPSNGDDFASASEVARVAYCERQISLDRLHGKATTPVQLKRRIEGDEAHRRFFEDARATGNPRDFAQQDQRYFVASLAFGHDAPETRLLRTFRDTVLAPHAAGRLFVRFYYLTSPALCRALAPYPRAVALCRQLLQAAALPLASGLLARARCHSRNGR
jgi:hypothetical protein